MPLASITDHDPSETPKSSRHWTRRDLIHSALGAGAASTVFARALTVLTEEQPAVTLDMIRQAEWISGLHFTDEQRELMLDDVNKLAERFETLRAVPLDNSVSPAVRFSCAAALDEHDATRETNVEPLPTVAVQRPSSDDDLAFATVTELAHMLETRQVSSIELTRLAIDRLRTYDPLLECVITLTEERALEQARQADVEIAAGGIRGPLHGVPWGAKDLFSVPGYRTTWGAVPFQDQVREETATPVSRLDEAGAVLVGKLTLGALARGNVWYGGETRNPWQPEQGSSGSSAGSAAAVAAGLVGFALGTETLGSIVSPCTRCGASGLRPTFGRVSRHGAMALAWSMDKPGTIARTVEDCALVFGAIHGADGRDPTAIDRPFRWPPEDDPRRLRVGYVPEWFELDRTEDEEDEQDRADLQEWQAIDLRTLDTLRELGFNLVPIELESAYPVEELRHVLYAEAAAAFDELVRNGQVDRLVRQAENAWPNTFRLGQLIPAVEYIRANRIRSLLMQEVEQKLSDIDVWVSPSWVGPNLVLTNLTGHPTVVVPNGFLSSDGTPTSITFNGRLFGETAALGVAHEFQRATDFHRQRPPIARFLEQRQRAESEAAEPKRS